jgi:hypothetical protein
MVLKLSGRRVLRFGLAIDDLTTPGFTRAFRETEDGQGLTQEQGLAVGAPKKFAVGEEARRRGHAVDGGEFDLYVGAQDPFARHAGADEGRLRRLRAQLRAEPFRANVDEPGVAVTKADLFAGLEVVDVVDGAIRVDPRGVDRHQNSVALDHHRKLRRR